MVLFAQHFDQIHELIGFFKAREKKVFLELLVIIFNETANDPRGIHQSLRRKILLRVDATQYFAVN